MVIDEGRVSATFPDKEDGDCKDTNGAPLESCNLIGSPFTTSKPALLIETLVVPDVENHIVLAPDLYIPVSVSVSKAYAGNPAPEPSSANN